MIKLTVLVKRKVGLEPEEFHAIWRAHGKMISEEPAFRKYIRRYEQHHAPLGAKGPYDGLVFQWFDSVDDFYALLADAAYTEKMQPDEDRMLDMDGIVVLFTEEAETFIP